MVNFYRNFPLETPQIQENEPSFSVDDFQLSGEQQNQAQPESLTGEDVPTPEIEQYLEQLRKDISPGEQPEWLQKENLGSDIEALFNEDKKPAEPPASFDQSPSWMADLKKEDLEPPQVPQNNAPISVPNVPDWLFTPETNDGDTAPIDLDAPVTKQPSPDWLKDVKPEVLGLSDNQEPFNINQSNTSETEDQVPDLSFLDSKTFDFQQADRDLFVDNLNISEETSGEGLPADLAALLREEAEADVHTNPLPDEEPVSQSFTPSDFFTDLGYQPENDTEAVQNQPSVLQSDVSASIEPEVEPEIRFDTINDQQVPPEEHIQFKETGPVFSAEVIQTFMDEQIPNAVEAVEQPVAQFIPEDQPAAQVIPEEQPVAQFIPEEEPVTQVIQEEQPVAQFIPEEMPVAQVVPDEQPAAQFIPEEMPETQVVPEEQPVAQFIPEEEPVTQAIQEEQPVAQFIPEVKPVAQVILQEKPIAQVIPQEKPVVQPVPVEKPTAIFEEKEQPVIPPVQETKPAAKIIVEEKPVKKERQVIPVPPPVKPVQTPVSRPVRKIEKPVEPTIQKRSGGAADLARAREAVARGDLIAGLRRYIKLVNANKSLDHVSSDLKDLVRKNPKNYLAWQTYGDARLHSNRIQEALDAYAKAADLLK